MLRQQHKTMDYFYIHLNNLCIKLSNQKIILTKTSFDEMYERLESGKLVCEIIDVPDDRVIILDRFDLSWMLGVNYPMLVNVYRKECVSPNFFYQDQLYVLYMFQTPQGVQSSIMRMDVKINKYVQQINLNEKDLQEQTRRHDARVKYLQTCIDKCIKSGHANLVKDYQILMDLNEKVYDLTVQVYSR